MSEEWRDVPDWLGYQVSDHGRVRSSKRRDEWRALTPYLIDGYERVDLWDAPRRRQIPIHRLVLEAFVGPMPAGMEVRHLDGDRTNNRLSNLAYGTRSENVRDKRAHGTDHNVNKTHCPAGHPYTPDNTETHLSSRHCRACRKARTERNRLAREAARTAEADR